MRKDNVRRYPVLNKKNELIGIITDTDILNASPSEASTLSIWEVNYLLSKITVERVMTRDVITVQEDATIEEAAQLMADKKVGGLPVLRGDKLVGVITETDLFRIFLEMLGTRRSGVRVTVEVKDGLGKLHEITGAIRKVGGDIYGMGGIQGSSVGMIALTLKIANVDLEDIRAALTPVVDKIMDIRIESVK
jgi:acetoin utilization protein AcuB